MNELEQWLRQESHNYILIAVAAILFFVIKAIIGYITYRHYDRKLNDIEHKLNLLMQRQNEPDRRS
ncbi:hypothetical protein [Paenibacillus faecalis]|uniref:hypothetical protein n=1 Tax=Paenibacillus faecalis TaxID=2079532 RepID=UPI000D0EDEFB|nr:hypothetical protein [Paenibacillus faecalis]